MKTEISYADWLDWLAFELTFVELYMSGDAVSEAGDAGDPPPALRGHRRRRPSRRSYRRSPTSSRRSAVTRPRNGTASCRSSRWPSPTSPSSWPAPPENGIEAALGRAPQPPRRAVAPTRQDRCVHHGQTLWHLVHRPAPHPPQQAGYPHLLEMTHQLIPPPRGRGSRLLRDEEWCALVNRLGLASREAGITRRVFVDLSGAAR